MHRARAPGAPARDACLQKERTMIFCRKYATRIAAAVLLVLSGTGALAQVTISNPWVRGTVSGMKATGAFMQISSRADTRLVSAASPAAQVVEVHEMAVVDNVMRMRAIPAIAVPAGKPVELKPGGFHVMLIGLVKPLEPGTSVPITLTFEGRDGKRETVQVKAEVRPLNAGGSKSPGASAAGHSHGH
jgi:copper(I)-binding protein